MFHDIKPARIWDKNYGGIHKDYSVKHDNQKITSIVNRECGSVRFTAKKIDSDAGFQAHGEIKIWTNISNDVINIVHVHVDDTSEEATFDFQIVLIADYDLREINFGVDAFGRKQRYKVIVFNLKIVSVLYNTGSSIEKLKFKEILVSDPGTFITFGNFFGKISKIPNYCCSSADPDALSKVKKGEANFKKVNFCSYRMFEEMPGYIEVECLSLDGVNSVIETYQFVSACVCQVEKPSEEKTQMYEILQ